MIIISFKICLLLPWNGYPENSGVIMALWKSSLKPNREMNLTNQQWLIIKESKWSVLKSVLSYVRGRTVGGWGGRRWEDGRVNERGAILLMMTPLLEWDPSGWKLNSKFLFFEIQFFFFLRQTSVSFSSFLIKSFKFNPTCSGDSFFNCLVDFHTLLVVDFFTFSSRFNSIKVFRYGPLKRDTEKAYIQFELDKQSKRLLEIASNFNPILNGRYNAKLWD